MVVKKVENDGKHLRDTKSIITFLVRAGWRTPKYIWVGYSNDDIEITDMTKKDCMAAIERDNRLSAKGIFNTIKA